MRLRAALVGCGAMSRAWLEAAGRIDDLEIVGLADLDTGRAQSRADEFDLPSAIVAATAEELLAKTKPDLLFDVVVPAARHSVVATGLRMKVPEIFMGIGLSVSLLHSRGSE